MSLIRFLDCKIKHHMVEFSRNLDLFRYVRDIVMFNVIYDTMYSTVHWLITRKRYAK